MTAEYSYRKLSEEQRVYARGDLLLLLTREDLTAADKLRLIDSFTSLLVDAAVLQVLARLDEE